MKKRSCREDVDVQAEKATARQINTAVERTNGTNFRKGNMLKRDVGMFVQVRGWDASVMYRTRLWYRTTRCLCTWGSHA